MAGKSAAHTESGIPSTRDAALAERAVRKLADLTDDPGPVPARFGAAAAEPVDIPTPAVRLLREILDQMAHGHGVALMPMHAELTTGEAADLLQVSRTHVVQLLDDGRIPCRMVGAHRRIRAADIVAYRRETETRRGSALDELTARDQELCLQ